MLFVGNRVFLHVLTIIEIVIVKYIRISMYMCIQMFCWHSKSVWVMNVHHEQLYIDHVEQSPTHFNCLQCVERFFIVSSDSSTSPPQCLPLIKNNVRLLNGEKAVKSPACRPPPSTIPFLYATDKA